IQNGSGTLILTGTNGYTGVTTISAGTLKIGNGGTNGSFGNGIITNNATLTFNRSDTISVTNRISGSGSLIQVGPGTLALYGANNYSGITTISAGTLLVNGLLGTNHTTVAANATLGGSGHISGLVTISAGGMFSPGNNGLGTLTISNNLVLGGNALMAVSKTGSVTTNDVAFVTGVLTEGGTLIVTNIGVSALASGDSFKLFNAATYAGTSFATLTLPALATGLYWNTNLLATSGILSVTNFTFTLNYSAGANGSLSGSTTQIVNYAASGSPVTPTANTGYYFANWSDSGTANPRTDTNVTANLSVTANFAVLVPATFSGNLTVSGNQLQFTFSGVSGEPYKILTAPDLTIPLTNWLIVSSGIFGNDPVTFTNNLAPDSTNGYFRITSP
ncbi:MAG TPA: autotransporter-associated beta strand repeat-containing protein, partial [Verrucomicrobiae bacterium]